MTNVVLYDKETDGVASVRFSNPEAANACVRVSLISFQPALTMEIVYLLHTSCSYGFITPQEPHQGTTVTLIPRLQVMSGRFFDGIQVIAYISTGTEKFAKSNESKLDVDVDEVEGADKETEEKKRLDKFGAWLEEGAKEEEVDAED